MDLLNAMVEGVVPQVSPGSGRVVRTLVAARGSFGDAKAFARSMGFRNRDQLRRTLAADGLPCLEDLAGWIRVLKWVIDAEDAGVALSRGALRAGKYPCSCYRTVKRLTGRAWGEVRVLGSAWVLLQFSAALGPPGGAGARAPLSLAAGQARPGHPSPPRPVKTPEA